MLATSRDILRDRPLSVTVAGTELVVWRDAADGEEPLAAPVVPARPPLAASICAVATLAGVCEPEDIVANRLDPWRGAWFRPYSLTRLSVLAAPDESVVSDEHDRFAVLAYAERRYRLRVE